ncbi:MAG: hypothetical protein U1F43_19950 [Myxococcota bacterium]
MSKLVVSIVVSAFCLVAACGGSTPVDKMVGHMEKLASILEDNKANPDKAGDAVAAYMKDNEASLKAAKDEAEKYMDTMKEGDKMDVDAMTKVMEKVAPIMERMEKLKKENPELMKNEKVHDAMRMMR